MRSAPSASAKSTSIRETAEKSRSSIANSLLRRLIWAPMFWGASPISCRPGRWYHMVPCCLNTLPPLMYEMSSRAPRLCTVTMRPEIRTA